MNSKVYKTCAVPQCENTSIKTPNKLFIYVPSKKNIRKKWLELARRDVAITAKTSIYFCEDHFDLPNDMINYMEYHIMGSVSKVLTKPGCMPKKFDCQKNIRKQISGTTENPHSSENEKYKAIVACLNKTKDSLTTELGSVIGGSSSSSSGKDNRTETSCEEYKCSICNCVINGMRYTCVQCSAVELCIACEQNGQHAEHYVLRVPGARLHAEVEGILKQIRNIFLGTTMVPNSIGTTPACGTEVVSSIPARENYLCDERRFTVELEIERESEIKTELDIKEVPDCIDDNIWNTEDDYHCAPNVEQIHQEECNVQEDIAIDVPLDQHVMFRSAIEEPTERVHETNSVSKDTVQYNKDTHNLLEVIDGHLILLPENRSDVSEAGDIDTDICVVSGQQIQDSGPRTIYRKRNPSTLHLNRSKKMEPQKSQLS